MSMIYAQFGCAMLRDPKVVTCGPMPRLLYVQAVLYCRENLTDGKIEEALLGYVSMDIPKPRQAVAKLLEVGLLEVCDGGWRIPLDVWRKWNPLKSEVEAKRAEEAQRKANYREKKREVSADVPTGQVVTATDCPGQAKAKAEPKEKAEENKSSNNSKSADSERVGEILERYALIAVERATDVKDRNAYMAKAKHTARGMADLYRWLELFPTAPADAVAGWLHGDKGSMNYYPRADELADVIELRPA